MAADSGGSKGKGAGAPSSLGGALFLFSKFLIVVFRTPVSRSVCNIKMSDK